MRKVRATKLLVVIACLACILLRQTAAEEESILKDAQVSPENVDFDWTGDPNAAIGPGFKSFTHYFAHPKGDDSYD